MTDSPDKIQWHPAFFGATEMEFKFDKEEIEMVSEYKLSKEPIRIDLLIIKKMNIRKKTVMLKNELGHIMRKYNIIEYKSPDDSINIDDFFKTLGYAFLFKGYGKKVDYIPIKEMTISLFRDKYPKKMFATLRKQGFDIKEQYPGIYYVTGEIPIPAQVVVISQLSPEKHSSLRILSKNVEKSDVERFLSEVSEFTDSGDIYNANAVLQASGSANYELYEKIRRENNMCEFLRRLFKDEIEELINKGVLDGKNIGIKEGIKEGIIEGKKEGIIEGKKEGIKEGRIEGNMEAVNNIMNKLSYTAEQAMDLLEIPESQREVIIARL